MKTCLRIELPDKPISLQRARSSKGRFYDAQYDVKERLRIYIKQHFDYHIFNVSICVKFVFYLPIPKSWSKKKTLKYQNQPHHKRPDIDNLIKFILDAFNNVLWTDDCIIASIEAKKIYSSNPKTIIEVKEL